MVMKDLLRLWALAAVLVLCVIPVWAALGQWPGASRPDTRTLVTLSSASETCTESCAPRTCVGSFRLGTAWTALESVSPAATLLPVASALVSADWTETTDQTGEFVLDGAKNHFCYNPSDSTLVVFVSTQVNVSGSRVGAGMPNDVIFQLGKHTAGPPVAGDEVGPALRLTTNATDLAFSGSLMSYTPLVSGECLGLLGRGDPASVSVAFNTVHMVARRALLALSSCEDTAGLRNCACAPG